MSAFEIIIFLVVGFRQTASSGLNIRIKMKTGFWMMTYGLPHIG